MSNTNQSNAVSTPYQFWLIERGPNQQQVPHMWWVRVGERPFPLDSYDWTPDATKATRFATKEEAEAAAQEFLVRNFAVTSHGFVGADDGVGGVPQPSPDLCPKCGSEEWDYVYEAGRVSPSYKRCAYSACDTEWSAQ